MHSVCSIRLNFCRLLRRRESGRFAISAAYDLQLLINLNSAAMGLAIPPGLLATADEVIESSLVREKNLDGSEYRREATFALLGHLARPTLSH